VPLLSTSEHTRGQWDRRRNSERQSPLWAPVEMESPQVEFKADKARLRRAPCPEPRLGGYSSLWCPQRQHTDMFRTSRPLGFSQSKGQSGPCRPSPGPSLSVTFSVTMGSLGHFLLCWNLSFFLYFTSVLLVLQPSSVKWA
jgi:hypothetical protein